jgi:spermidine synthase
MGEAKPYYISPAFAFVAYPNRDSTPFREWYDIPEAETVVRGTLRYQGFPEFIQALVKLGWLDDTKKTWLKEGVTWKQITKVLVDAGTNDELTEAEIVERVKAKAEFPNHAEAERIISGLRWIGAFSDELAQLRAGNLLDTLCARLEVLMKYDVGERDLVMLQHKFVVEWADGIEVSDRTGTIVPTLRDTDPFQQILTSTLEAYGSTAPEGYSAMARTVGVPCGIATQLVLDGVLKEPGVHAPYTPEVCEPLRKILEAEGLGLIERAL